MTISASTPKPGTVRLTYIGNSCTLMVAPDGTRIVSDPYHDFEHPAGLLAQFPGDLQAEAVTVSHEHFDHSNAAAVGGEPLILKAGGVFEVGMVRVTGYAGYEGSPSGPSQNAHVVFVFEIGKIKIVHLGDSGPITEPEVLAAIENADVLLANIDGYVIPAGQLFPFLEAARVRTFIPTHYSLSAAERWQDAPTIEEFLASLPAGLAAVPMGSEIEVSAGMPRQVAAMSSMARVG